MRASSMKRKYSFRDFLTKDTFVGVDAVTNEKIEAVIDKIEIPMIQRDYAQGRTKQGKGDERVLNDTGSRFLKSIFNTLTNDSKEEMELEFIYGSVDQRGTTKNPEYVFVPLDGQQRLTTLFLLYWYLGMRELEVESEARREHLTLLGKFTYLTRLSSRIFCQSICDFEKMRSMTLHMSPEDLLTDCPWYYKEYRKDPTVSAMLSMLNHIHKLYERCHEEGQELLPRMEKLKFYIFPLNKYRLTEDLYIKMNARGKQLSNYENFKADLINWMKTSADVRFRESVEYRGRMMSYYMAFAQKLDNEWTDIFWQCAHSVQPDEQRRDLAREVDDMFMTFFHRFFYIDRILTLQDGGQVVTSDDVVKYFDRDESAIRYNNNDFENIYERCLSYEAVSKIEVFLDRIRATGVLDVVNSEFSPIWESAVSGRHIFVNTEKLTFAPRLVFQAVFDYFCRFDTFNEEQFRNWIRVVWKFAVDPIISNIRYYADSVRIIATTLNQGMDDMMKWLVDGGAVSVGHFSVQYAEECVKAQLITKDAAWRGLLEAGERHPLLKGRINCLLPQGADTDMEVYKSSLAAFSAFDLNEHRRLWLRALLAKIEEGYAFDKELGLSNDHENMKVYINSEFVKPMHALLADIVAHVGGDVTTEKVLKHMTNICDEYTLKEGLEWVYPLVKSFTCETDSTDKNLLADYTNKRKIVVRDGHVYLCKTSRFDQDSVMLLNGSRDVVIKALLKNPNISIINDNGLYEESGRYFRGYVIDLVRELPREDMSLKCIYRVGAESLKLSICDAVGKEYKVSVDGLPALAIDDNMTSTDIDALIAKVDARVAELQTADNPFEI